MLHTKNVSRLSSGMLTKLIKNWVKNDKEKHRNMYPDLTFGSNLLLKYKKKMPVEVSDIKISILKLKQDFY